MIGRFVRRWSWVAASAAAIGGLSLALGSQKGGISEVDAWLTLGSGVLFVLMMAGLVAFRVGPLSLLVFAYLATPFFANRLLGRVWLGPADEAVAGTFAPFLLGDLVLLFVLVRWRLRLPAWLPFAAVLVLMPYAASLASDGFEPGAFWYQYVVLIRFLTLASVTRNLLLAGHHGVLLGALRSHLALIFGVMGLLTGSLAALTGQRFGMPGWGVNVYANALCVVGVLTVTTALKRRSLLFWLCSAGCFIGIVGSGTRFALLLFLVVSATSALSQLLPPSTRRGSLVLLGLLTAAVLTLAPGYVVGAVASFNPRAKTIGGLEVEPSAKLPSIATAVFRESSVRTRLMLWTASLGMVAAEPLTGVGWGQWNWRKGDFGVELHVLLDPHNGYLWLFSEGGVLVGITSLALVLWLIGRTPRSEWRLAFLLMLILEMVNSNAQKSLYGVLAALIVGALLTIGSGARYPAKERQLTGT